MNCSGFCILARVDLGFRPKQYFLYQSCSYVSSLVSLVVWLHILIEGLNIRNVKMGCVMCKNVQKTFNCQLYRHLVTRQYDNWMTNAKKHDIKLVILGVNPCTSLFAHFWCSKKLNQHQSSDKNVLHIFNWAPCALIYQPFIHIKHL
jgi:hypothetical protein